MGHYRIGDSQVRGYGDIDIVGPWVRGMHRRVNVRLGLLEGEGFGGDELAPDGGKGRLDVDGLGLNVGAMHVQRAEHAQRPDLRGDLFERGRD